MDGGGLGVQWGREQTFASGEATDETTSSSAHNSILKRCSDRRPVNRKANFSHLSDMEPGTDTDHEGFKIPSAIPQDILLIQDLIGIIPPTQPLTSPATEDDSVDSSGESTDSTDEVETNLLFVGGKSRRSVFIFHVFDPVTDSILARILLLPLPRPLPRHQTLRVTGREMFRKKIRRPKSRMKMTMMKRKVVPSLQRSARKMNYRSQTS
jgi:hypothetical protein